MEGYQAFMDKAEHQASAVLARVAAAQPDPSARQNWRLQEVLLGVRFGIEALRGEQTPAAKSLIILLRSCIA